MTRLASLLKIPQLKALCRERRLAVGGNKGDLIERLRSGGSAAPLPPPPPPPSGAAAERCCCGGGGGLRARDLHLKGVDVLLFVAAARAGLSPRVVTLIMGEDSDELFVVRDLPSLAGAREMATPVLIESSFIAPAIDFEAVSSSVTVAGRTLDGSNILDDVQWVLPLNDYGTAVVAPPKKPLLSDVWTSSTGYFGNEASTSTVYASCAIILEVRCRCQLQIYARGLNLKYASCLLSDVWTSATGYFGNEASTSTVYASCAIILGVRRRCQLQIMPWFELQVCTSPLRHFGNEASTSTVYASCAILLEVPPYAERAAAIAATAAAADDGDATAFAGSKRGFEPSAEERAAERQLQDFEQRHRGKLDVEEMHALARRYGVGVSGSAAAIKKRIERAAARENGECDEGCTVS
ncbi:hypothetical protein JKP88DRAFT_245815 [Tribonema minus]|uniref:SAP domain-containing protein n=1 Tax=Tribonema minus TaxID=303371 RepID=A0A835YVG7_9STRA|nr:hypothetical protein JKP88DRAFT_245815 [Tribonema minus]